MTVRKFKSTAIGIIQAELFLEEYGIATLGMDSTTTLFLANNLYKGVEYSRKKDLEMENNA